MTAETLLLVVAVLVTIVVTILAVSLIAEALIMLFDLRRRWREKRHHDKIMKNYSVTDD